MPSFGGPSLAVRNVPTMICQAFEPLACATSGLTFKLLQPKHLPPIQDHSLRLPADHRSRRFLAGTITGTEVNFPQGTDA